MNPTETPIRVLLIDSNVYFVRRMTEALENRVLKLLIIQRLLTRSPCWNGILPM